MPVRELATVTDKAFAWLQLENIWDIWMEVDVVEFFSGKRKRDADGKRVVVPGKYTQEWRSASKFAGWNEQGLKRMNELIKIVTVDRRRPVGLNWETDYLMAKKLALEGAKRTKKVKGAGQLELVVDDL